MPLTNDRAHSIHFSPSTVGKVEDPSLSAISVVITLTVVKAVYLLLFPRDIGDCHKWYAEAETWKWKLCWSFGYLVHCSSWERKRSFFFWRRQFFPGVRLGRKMEIKSHVGTDSLEAKNKYEDLFRGSQRMDRYFIEGKSIIMSTWKQVDKAVIFIADFCRNDTSETDEASSREKINSIFSLSWNPIRPLSKHWLKNALTGSHQLVGTVALHLPFVYSSTLLALQFTEQLKNTFIVFPRTCFLLCIFLKQAFKSACMFKASFVLKSLRINLLSTLEDVWNFTRTFTFHYHYYMLGHCNPSQHSLTFDLSGSLETYTPKLAAKRRQSCETYNIIIKIWRRQNFGQMLVSYAQGKKILLSQGLCILIFESFVSDRTNFISLLYHILTQN